jgi:hypothetical protein
MPRKQHDQKGQQENSNKPIRRPPHHPSEEKNINPKDTHDRKAADTDRHNGSAHAFEGTEDPSGGEE